MSRTTPGTRPSAAPYCNRIDLEPSTLAAVLAGGWLLLVSAMIFAAVALPLPARITACAAVAVSGFSAIRGGLLLRGDFAVRGLSWSRSGWTAWLGPARIEKQVSLGPGCFRIGRVLVLWLRACDGTYGVCIDAGAQDPKALRRLCRRLRRAASEALDEPGPAS